MIPNRINCAKIAHPRQYPRKASRLAAAVSPMITKRATVVLPARDATSAETEKRTPIA
jgi:hypothetical protein